MNKLKTCDILICDTSILDENFQIRKHIFIAIKNGTTGFVDAGSYFMEEASQVYLVSGLRGALSHSSMDQGNFPDSIRQTTEEVLASENQLFDEFHGKGNLKVFYSLRALINCSQELIVKTAERAAKRNTFP